MLLSVSGNEDASEKLSSLGLNKVERVRGGSALPGCSAEVRVEGALGPADPGKQPPSPKGKEPWDICDTCKNRISRRVCMCVKYDRKDKVSCYMLFYA